MPMLKNEEKFITVSELQAGISEAVKSVESEGSRYLVMRYSKPTSILLSYKEYQELKRLAKIARGGACKACGL